MKVVEVRRHSLRDKEGNLSEEGRKLAQKAALTLEGNYNKIISSPSARAIQTAEAFGFKNIEKDDRFGGLPSEKITPHEGKVEETRTAKNLTLLQAYYEVPETRMILEEWGKNFLQSIISVSKELPDGGRALIVSHSGSIEPATLAALNKSSLNEIGGQFSECEGAKFFVHGDEIIRVDIIRLSMSVRSSAQS